MDIDDVRIMGWREIELIVVIELKVVLVGKMSVGMWYGSLKLRFF